MEHVLSYSRTRVQPHLKIVKKNNDIKQTLEHSKLYTKLDE